MLRLAPAHTCRAFAAIWCIWSGAGCSDDQTGVAPPSPSACAPPDRTVGDRCLAPGVQDDGCAAGTLGAPDGSCVPAGVPADGCSVGFVHDGDIGCEPVLPAARCAPGSMAVPGDAECRPVSPCAPGKWGDIPVDATTQHVDAMYAGADSDGTAAKPWTTIGLALAAAADGAVIAVAEGSYVEDLDVAGKPIRLWGVCPEKVEIVASGQQPAALFIRTQADGTELHTIAITGTGAGIVISGSENVLVDRCWIHDTTDRGLDIEGTLGTTSSSVVGVLVERSRDFGIYVSNAVATIEGSAVRQTELRFDGRFGRGINAQLACDASGCDPSARADLTVRGSHVEGNHDSGVFVEASDAVVDASVVRGTLPLEDGTLGIGITIQATCTPDGCQPSTRASATVLGSVVDANHDIGVAVVGSDATIDRTVVRRTSPQASDGGFGRGIVVSMSCGPTTCDVSSRASGEVRASVIDDNHEAGVFAMGSDLTVETTVVRGTKPRASDGHLGHGVHLSIACVETGCLFGTSAVATVRGCRIEQSRVVGLLALYADATVVGTLVRLTLPQLADGLFGDGVAVIGGEAPGAVALTSVLIEESARAGVLASVARASLASSAIRCAAIDLDEEDDEATPGALEDLGNNACGCPDAVGPCVKVSTGLEPPDPIGPP